MVTCVVVVVVKWLLLLRTLLSKVPKAHEQMDQSEYSNHDHGKNAKDSSHYQRERKVGVGIPRLSMTFLV